MGFYTKQEIRDKVDEIILDTLDVNEEAVTPNASLKWDLMADSLDAIEVAIRLERAFGVNITDYQIKEMSDGVVEDIYTMIEEMTK